MDARINDVMPRDREAVEIGILYEKAFASAAGVFQLDEVGRKLIAKHKLLGQQQWLPWLMLNEDVLGFGIRAAAALMRGSRWLAANWKVVDDLEEALTTPTGAEHGAQLIGERIRRKFRPTVRGAVGTGRNEWFTPQRYLALVRNVLGEIDLDPATTEQAQEIVKARQFFDATSNGLHHPWCGRVFLNPPYSDGLIGRFIAKLIAEWRNGDVTAAIALTHNHTDAVWFQDLASVASAICFTSGRIRFYGPKESIATPTEGQAFCYLGDDVEAFKREFSRIGFIAQPDSTWRRRAA